MSLSASETAAARDPAAGGELIYEVTLDLPRRHAARFDAWLKARMREMLALPGFLDAQVLPADQVSPGPDPHCVRRVVRYRLSGYADLLNYAKYHAARMRADAVRHFGRLLRSSRRLLDPQGRELLSGEALPLATVCCLNCGAPLAGKFCAACGQPHHSYSAPLREVLEEFFGEHLGMDTKFFRSVGPLWFRPGFLSSEYSAGRRVRYISPLRLIIFSSLLFFLVAWGSAPAQFFHFGGASEPESRKALTPQEQQQISSIPYLSEAQKQEILQAAARPEPGDHSSGAAAGNTDDVHLSMFGHSVNMPRAEFQYRVQHALESDLPKLMFIFLPLVALLLTLFYLGSRRYYTEHLVFTLHTHAFVFEAMLVMLLAHLLGKRFGWAVLPAHYLNVLIGWYIVVYVFLAMLFYYRQSFLKTLGKYLVIGGIYWIVLVGVVVAGSMLALAMAVTG